MAVQYGINDTLNVRGTLDVSSGTLNLKDDQISRSKLAREDNALLGIPVTDFRTWDDLSALPPGTAAADDLAVIEGTWGTDAPTLQTADFGGTSSTAYSRVLIPLTNDYIMGETLTLRLNCGMITTVADTSCTIDVECYVNDGDGSVGSDLCATAAQDMNSLTHASKDFTITATSLASGDTLDVRVAVTYVDSGDAGVMIGEIAKALLVRDIRP